MGSRVILLLGTYRVALSFYAGTRLELMSHQVQQYERLRNSVRKLLAPRVLLRTSNVRLAR